MAEYDNKVALGSSITQLVTLIKNALTGKQNTLTAGSGIDITNDVISSTGGGSSLPTDPSTDGSYKLVNTVETESGKQTATLSWEEDSGYTAGDGIEIDNGVIKQDLTSYRSFSTVWLSLLTLFNGINPSNSAPAFLYSFLSECTCYTLEGAIKLLNMSGCFLVDRYNTIAFTWGDIANYIGVQAIQTAYIGQYHNSDNGYFYDLSSNALKNLSSKPSRNTLYIYVPSNNYSTNFIEIPIPYNDNSLAISANGKVLMPDTTLTGTRTPTINTALIALQNTRIADSLSSTADTPTTNNTIIWQYE